MIMSSIVIQIVQRILVTTYKLYVLVFTKPNISVRTHIIRY